MGFPLEAYNNKIIFEGGWHTSNGVYTETDLKSGESVAKPEPNVLGRFVKVGIFQPHASTPDKLVYKPAIVCEIKINDTYNHDVASHLIDGSLKAKSLQKRFAAAWTDFVKNGPQTKRAQTEHK